MGEEHKQATDGGPNPLYDPREDAIDAIAEHLAEDDTAYEAGDEAERQAQRIMDAIERRDLRVVHPSRVAALEAREARLVAVLEECAKELEDEITNRYVGTSNYPSMIARMNRDLEPVRRARAELDAAKGGGDAG